MQVSNPLARSVFVVAITWWVYFTIKTLVEHWEFFIRPAGLAALIRYQTFALVALAMGIAVGVAWGVWRKIKERIEVDQELRSKNRLGMLCTLGNMPIQTNTLLVTSGQIPAWFFDPEVIPHGPALMQWIEKSSRSHPYHCAALIALIRVFAQFKDLPASHVPNGHGGRTLVDHSARVGALMIEEAKNFSYRGLQSKYGNEPPTDPGYVFDSTDPIIPIIGFAHDIGKLQTFKLDHTGRVIESAPKHDLIGSRLLSTMDEIKQLPGADQFALHRAISFYHHPSEYPLTKQGVLDDDRAVALMMVLIRADKRAGKEEAGKSLTQEEYALHLRYMQDLGEELTKEEEGVIATALPLNARVSSKGTVSDAAVKAAVLAVLADPLMVLRENPKGNAFKNAVGQVMYTSYPQWAWDWIRSGDPLDEDAQQRLNGSIQKMVVLNEAKFRVAVAKKLGLDTSTLPKKGDGRYLLTIQILQVFQEMGVLYTEGEGGDINPLSALYRVEVQNRKTGATISSWTSIVLWPTGELQQMGTTVHPSLVKIVRPVWNDRKAKPGGTAPEGQENATDSAEYAADTEVLLDDPVENVVGQQLDTSADSNASSHEVGATGVEDSAEIAVDPVQPNPSGHGHQDQAHLGSSGSLPGDEDDDEGPPDGLDRSEDDEDPEVYAQTAPDEVEPEQRPQSPLQAAQTADEATAALLAAVASTAVMTPAQKQERMRQQMNMRRNKGAFPR